MRDLQNPMNVLDETLEATPWRDRMVYGAFLSQAYYYVSHSTRLHRRFARSATEEMAHEALVLRDLQRLGLSLAQFPELAVTRAFHQTQDTMIEQVSPASFRGYLRVLEGLAVTRSRWLFDEIQRHHGEGAASFVSRHAAERPGAMAEAEQALQALPERDRPLVVAQVASACFYACAMLAGCAAHAGMPVPVAAVV